MASGLRIGSPRAKSELRVQLLAQRRVMTEPQWRSASAVIRDRLEEYIETQGVSSVGLYAPLVGRREVDVTDLHARLRARGVEVAYPFMRGATRGFAWANDVDLLERCNGFAQPPSWAVAASPGQLALIVVPALATTARGFRLGYGAGFYDQLLPRFCPPGRAVCVVFHAQILPELPVEPHDAACDGVLSEVGWTKPLG